MAEEKDMALWEGISVMDTLDRAMKRARRFTMHGAYIAEISVPNNGLALCKRTLKTPGHHTFYANADLILSCVTRIIPVEPEEEGQ